jgi:hypothetical protein
MSASSTGAMCSRFTVVVHRLAWSICVRITWTGRVPSPTRQHRYGASQGDGRASQCRLYARVAARAFRQSWSARSDPSSTGTHKSKTRSLRGQPGAQRSLCGALYTIFLCSSTLLWFLSPLLIELREACTTSVRLFRRMVEISQALFKQCRSGCTARYTSHPHGDGPRGAPINHQLGDVHCTAALYLVVSAQDSERLRPPLSLLLACAHRSLFAIAIRKLSNE